MITGIIDQMAAEFPEELPSEQVEAVALFGLNKIKFEGVPVTALPMVEFDINENVVWEWVSNI